LRYLSLDYKSGIKVMQSRFARGPQLHVRVISISSELYFVASGSVLSRLISSTVEAAYYDHFGTCAFW